MNAILQTCLRRGAFTLSFGTMEPAIVLRRMLDAVQVLAPEQHAALVGGTAFDAIPQAALNDDQHRWWGCEAAIQLVEDVIRTIDACTVPHGFKLACIDSDHFLLEPVLLSLGAAPAAGDTTDTTAPSPRVSALRARVRLP